MKAAISVLAVAAAVGASPLGSRQSTGAFSLRTYSPGNHTTATALFATELHSTDDGTTPVILNATDKTLRMADMSFLAPSSVMVSTPIRHGGSEPDFLCIGDIDSTTNMAPAQVVPAGYGTGFFVQNATAAAGKKTDSQVQLLGYKTSNGTAAQMLACSSVVTNGTKQVTVSQLQMWFGSGATPQGCSAIQLQLVSDQ